MPVKYLPYVPNTVQGQAILDNITRTRRVLRYRGNDEVLERIRRGLPLYEVAPTETVGDGSTPNLLLRGECLSACAYLKDRGIALDLVYIDPPFASGADYAKNVYLRRNPHKAKEIAAAQAELELDELRAFEEKMYGDIWNKEDYLNWMFENLHAIKSVMSETASIYVHLDWNIGHYVKVLLDEVFGESNFLNEIIWSYKRWTAPGDNLQKMHDVLFYYSRTETRVFNVLFQELSEGTNRRWGGRKSKVEFVDGVRQVTQMTEEQSPGTPLSDVWDIPVVNSQAIERCDYSTQKPEALLDRIISISSNENMIVADFFGGSGVTAKVAHDLGRRFVHVDVGVNSLQTARDRLQAAGAPFQVLDIQDGVSLFRNPVQTMDKLKSLITGLKNEDKLDKFWEGAITDSKLGTVPVYLPNLLDSSTKVLDEALMNRIINEAMGDLPDETKQVIVYYVDIFDENAVKKFIKERNATGIEIELRDLKQILDEVVLNDEAEYSVREGGGKWEVEITSFASDRLQQKIDEYNQKRTLNSTAKPIQISDNGLELIEWLSLDCTNDEGAWHSDAEIKIDKKGFVIRDGVKSKEFWDAKITSAQKPLRLKIRNIAGDESTLNLAP
jgi:adenine-specific DNA-methyltransferase